jgi:hypothetical protein
MAKEKVRRGGPRPKANGQGKQEQVVGGSSRPNYRPNIKYQVDVHRI